MAMQPPQQWYGEIMQSLGYLEGRVEDVDGDVKAVARRLEIHINQHEGGNPTSQHSNGQRVRQVAITTGKWGGLITLLYIILQTIQQWLGL